MNLGWECPRCHVIHAPDIKRCDTCVGGIPDFYAPPKLHIKQPNGDPRCRCGLKPTQTCTNPNCYRNG